MNWNFRLEGGELEEVYAGTVVNELELHFEACFRTAVGRVVCVKRETLQKEKKNKR